MFSGLRKQAALISTLATSDSLSLFDVVRQDVETAAAAVNQLSRALSVWRTESEPVEVELGELRRKRVSDERLLAAGIPLEELKAAESRTVLMRRAIAHGDLHGDNILIDSQGRPLLIDFGDVGDAFAVTDPIVLETSLAFHKSGPLRAHQGFEDFDWSGWFDFDLARATDLYAPVIRAARNWGASVDSESARFAMYYAHCMRQVKYGEIPVPSLLKFARSCLDRISG
jgi:serine/threonine protein kinase